MDKDKLVELAEQYERAAIADAGNGVNNMIYAERADRKFRIAAALRSHAQPK